MAVFTPDAAVPEKQNIFFGPNNSGSGAIKHWQAHLLSQSHFYERNIIEMKDWENSEPII